MQKNIISTASLFIIIIIYIYIYIYIYIVYTNRVHPYKYHVECTDRHLNVDKSIMWKALSKLSIYIISDNC